MPFYGNLPPVDIRIDLKDSPGMNTKLSITTKVGDQGTTHLFSGETISKHSSRTNTYGDIDELVSVLGIARSLTVDSALQKTLITLQRSLFIVGTELATSAEHLDALPQRVDAAMLEQLDAERETLEHSLPPIKGFILPGGTPVAAHLDLARTVARRCERRAVGLFEEGFLSNSTLLIWLNRLSDYLWLLARHVEGPAVLMKDE